MEDALVAFERLYTELPAALGAEIRRVDNHGERFVGVQWISDRGAADVGFWAREHVGGLVDLVLLDRDGEQRHWQHLEGPTIAELEAGFRELLAAYEALV